eukprot:m.369129 g.369129  ORF g.369129 m.369129 type:complete len:78 (-) comp48362_c0_seq1:25-258(-)
MRQWGAQVLGFHKADERDENHDYKITCISAFERERHWKTAMYSNVATPCIHVLTSRTASPLPISHTPLCVCTSNLTE